MSSVSIFNIYYYIQQWKQPVKGQYLSGQSKSTQSYHIWMRVLAAPYVFQCAWRSFWPEIYVDRTVYWDTWASSIFIGRMLAHIGEVAWVAQVSMAFKRANQEIHVLSNSKGTWFQWVVDFCANQAFVLCFIAEFFCNHAVFTENYLMHVIETSLWGVALGCLIPCSLYLYSQASLIKSDGERSVDMKQTFNFIIIITWLNILFVLGLVSDHIPMCYSEWQAGLDRNRVYSDVFTGALDSMFTRNKSQSWDTWKSDWLWMLAYFSGGVWSSLFLAEGPRAHIKKVKQE